MPQPEVLERAKKAADAEREKFVAKNPTSTPDDKSKSAPADDAAKKVADDKSKDKQEPLTITDESAIEFLKNKFGKDFDIASLDDLKEKITPKKDKPKKSDEEIEAEAFRWGVENKKITADDYVSAKNIGKVEKKQIVFEEFSAKEKAKNSKVTDEQIQSKFEKKYGEPKITFVDDEENIGEKKSVVVYELDQNDIDDEAENIIKRKTQPLENLKQEYNAALTNHEKVEAIKADISNLQKKVPKSYQLEFEGEKYEMNFDDATAEQLREELQNSYVLYVQNSDGKNPFDFDKFLEYSVWSDTKRRNDAMNIIKNAYADKRVLEELEAYKNPTKKPNAVDPSSKKKGDPEGDYERYRSQRRGY